MFLNYKTNSSSFLYYYYYASPGSSYSPRIRILQKKKKKILTTFHNLKPYNPPPTIPTLLPCRFYLSSKASGFVTPVISINIHYLIYAHVLNAIEGKEISFIVQDFLKLFGLGKPKINKN